mgnify:CR=1 FL=1
MKCIRILEYEAEDADALRLHLERSLLSHSPVVVVPDDFRLLYERHAPEPEYPKVTIRLMSERFE